MKVVGPRNPLRWAWPNRPTSSDGEQRVPTILVVDDDRTILHMVSKSLGGSGAEVLVARNAAEGLEILAQSEPDVDA